MGLLPLGSPLHLRPTATVDISAGRAFPYIYALVSSMEDDTVACRPYVEVGAWAPAGR